jgi:two-component system sensor histidine kinase BaeS
MPPHGWRTLGVDQKGRVLVGPRGVPEDGSRRNIVVNGVSVGAVIASPVERLTRNTDINFDRQQKRTSWLIVALSTMLAALATFPLARGLLAPVKRLVEGTTAGGGDFTTRVAVSSSDELGRLAQDFNQLASTLERNQQMRRDLMADISHELRTRWRCCAANWKPFRTACANSPGVHHLAAGGGRHPHQTGGRSPPAVDVRRRRAGLPKTSVDIITLLEVAAGAFRERFASRG